MEGRPSSLGEGVKMAHSPLGKGEKRGPLLSLEEGRTFSSLGEREKGGPLLSLKEGKGPTFFL